MNLFIKISKHRDIDKTDDPTVQIKTLKVLHGIYAHALCGRKLYQNFKRISADGFHGFYWQYK